MGAIDDIKKINAEIAKLRKEMGSNPIKPFDQKDLTAAKYTLEGIRAEVREMGSDLDYISKSFKDSVNELSRQNEYLKNSKKALSSIADISRKITDYRRGESSLSQDQLSNLKNQARVKFESLKNDLKSGQLSKIQANEVQEALNQQEMFDSAVERTITHQKQVNKEIGLLGQGIGGVAKALKKAGFGDLSKPLQDAIDKTKNARLQTKLNKDEITSTNEEINRGNTNNASAAQIRAGFMGKEMKDQQIKVDSLNAQNKSLSTQTSKYKNIGKSLTDQIHKFNVVDFLITAVVDGLLGADKATEELARGLGMSMDAAHEMRGDFADIANSSGNINITTKAVQESQMAMGKSLGTRAALNEGDLETMTNMVKTMGFQHDELVGLEKLSLSQGKSLKSNTNEILGGARAYASRNKLVVNEKEILKEVSNASASLKLSLGGSAQAVAEAAVQAKKFGINLEQAEKIAGSLLDFESSIESELSAELLTGKDLNLEKARGLALAGKSIEAAAAMLEQVGSSAEFGEMNVLQQQEIAKAMGMQKDELAASLIESEALAAMNAKEGQSALEAYNLEIAKGKSKEDMIKMLGEEAAENLEAQSNQSKFNAMVEKLKDIFVQVGDVLMPIFDILGSIFEIVGYVLMPVGLLLDAFTYIKDAISDSLPALITFGAVLAGILITQQALAYSKQKGLAYDTAQWLMSKKKLIVSAVTAISEKRQTAGKKKNVMLSIAGAAMEAFKSMAMYPFVGPVLGGIAAAAAVAYGVSLMSDGVIGPGGETIVSGPKGSIQVDKDDSMIVGTDLGGKKKPKKPAGDAGGTVNVDMGPTNALLQQLISAVNAGGSINLDGQKVGEALKLGAYKIQ